MITIRECQDGDMAIVRENALEEAVKGYPDLKPSPPCKTGLVDGRIVGLGGITILWDGVGEGWLILTKDVLTRKVESYRCIYRLMLKLIEENKLRRIQAHVRTDFRQAIKMIEALGFEREGLLREFCPDKCDVYMYARIK